MHYRENEKYITCKTELQNIEPGSQNIYTQEFYDKTKTSCPLYTGGERDIAWTRNRWEAKARTGDLSCPDDYIT
jgi:hypothetical protein